MKSDKTSKIKQRLLAYPSYEAYVRDRKRHKLPYFSNETFDYWRDRLRQQDKIGEG